MDQSASQVMELATNLDDVSGEQVAAAVDALLREGALDVWTTPITMKKGRPGFTLTALVQHDDQSRLARRIIELTGTFGVRFRAWDRLVLDRHHQTVTTPYGELRVKIGSLDGRILTAKCEYDDARQRAEQHGVDVAVVLAHGRAQADGLLAQHTDAAAQHRPAEPPPPSGARSS